MRVKKPYHINDVTFKYGAMAFAIRQHEYLSLPGEYIRRYPTEIVLRNLETGRMDEAYSVTGNMLINIEEESGDVTQKTLKKYSKYIAFTSFIYSKRHYLVIICLKNPQNFPKEFEVTPTTIIRPHYIHFPKEELWEKHDNLINKIEHNIKLTETEALDLAFTPKYMPGKEGAFIAESFAKIFKKAIITDENLKRDVATILAAIILHKVDKKKHDELMEEMEMEKYKTEIDEIFLNSEYGEELNQLKEEVKTQDKTIKTQEKELKTQEKELKTQEKELKTQDKTIKTQEKELKTQDKTINTQNEIIESIKKHVHKNGSIDDKTINKIILTLQVTK